MKNIFSIILVLTLFTTGCSQSGEEKVSQSVIDNKTKQDSERKDPNMDSSGNKK
ncbi:MAG: hypothetical protein MUE64_10050 [Ignavibacteriaceae bacterium]|nr:hypothetical protein [Ignavibacteriaceae bacterium]